MCLINNDFQLLLNSCGYNDLSYRDIYSAQILSWLWRMYIHIRALRRDFQFKSHEAYIRKSVLI